MLLQHGILVTVIGLVGCNEMGDSRDDTATPTARGTDQPTATITDTPSATLTPTATSKLTSTSRPTATPTATSTGTPTASTATTPTATQTPPSGSAKIAAADGDQYDQFGGSVAIDGETALIGASGTQAPHAQAAGAAYVFGRSNGTWRQQTKLTADDYDLGDKFGSAVALAGAIALIGAPWDEHPNGDSAGAAYVFTRGERSWVQEAQLAPADGDSGDRFGASVALVGHTAIIGAPRDEDPNEKRAGAAYVYERANNEWTQQHKLSATDGDQEDSFGDSVALADGTALIGASNEYPDGEPGEWRGAAYVFERTDSSRGQQAKLTATDGDSQDRFGYSVALANGTALVGAPGDEISDGSDSTGVDKFSGEDAGSAYVFDRSNGSWRQTVKLTTTDRDEDEQFGASVALADGTALVCAWGDEDPNGDKAGVTYVYGRSNDTWRQAVKLVPEDGDTKDVFGRAVALDRPIALVGAPCDEDPNGDVAGSAYVYTL